MTDTSVIDFTESRTTATGNLADQHVFELKINLANGLLERADVREQLIEWLDNAIETGLCVFPVSLDTTATLGSYELSE